MYLIPQYRVAVMKKGKTLFFFLRKHLEAFRCLHFVLLSQCASGLCECINKSKQGEVRYQQLPSSSLTPTTDRSLPYRYTILFTFLIRITCPIPVFQEINHFTPSVLQDYFVFYLMCYIFYVMSFLCMGYHLFSWMLIFFPLYF